MQVGGWAELAGGKNIPFRNSKVTGTLQAIICPCYKYNRGGVTCCPPNYSQYMSKLYARRMVLHQTAQQYIVAIFKPLTPRCGFDGQCLLRHLIQKKRSCKGEMRDGRKVNDINHATATHFGDLEILKLPKYMLWVSGWCRFTPSPVQRGLTMLSSRIYFFFILQFSFLSWNVLVVSIQILTDSDAA